MATLDLTAIVAKTKGNIDLVVRKVTLELFKSLVMKSPVDTGRFRGNWQLGVGAAPTGYSSKVDKSGGSVMSVANNAIPAQAAGKVYYLVNNLPYAQALENGHSGQAPRGMVGITVIEAQNHYNRAVEGIR